MFVDHGLLRRGRGRPGHQGTFQRYLAYRLITIGAADFLADLRGVTDPGQGGASALVHPRIRVCGRRAAALGQELAAFLARRRSM